jgi:ubiquinone biosynthesis protein Coq4
VTGLGAAQRVREIRARYFAENGFGDGGYDDRFVVLRAGGVPVRAFPNTKQRVRSVRIHDVHHVLTGHATPWRGEGEIGAWEPASGCRDPWAARKWDDGLLERSVGALRHELGLDAAL